MTPHLSLRIRHHTGFTYDGLAKSSYNEARMSPSVGSNQSVRQTQIVVTPITALASYRDYFDTIVTSFDIQQSHSLLSIESRSMVESDAALLAPCLSWEELQHRDLVDRYSDYLSTTKRTRLPESVLNLVETFREKLDVHECAEAVGELVRSRVNYLPGATSVSSTASDAWQQESGVCQDITHVTIGLMRFLGVPVRYVSGYLYPSEEYDIDVAVDGQSHAWIEYFAGQWTGIDPTNGLRETERHIIVGRGRDYDDVPPLKGIYQGPTSSNLGVVVQMSRVR